MSLDPDELHAWVDGRLDGERLRSFERQLEADPDLLEEARAWRHQNDALRALGRNLLAEPVPSRFVDLVRSHGVADTSDDPSKRSASERASARDATIPGARLRHARDPRAWLAAAAIAGVAWSAGWLMHGRLATDFSTLARAEPPAFVRDAVAAHVVYTPEVRHPVEVAAEQQQHLVQWLSKRLGTALTVPSLEAIGWSLVGGRLLPGTEGARAQFMYQDAAGARLTLYVAHTGTDEASHETAFRFDRAGSVSAFYWIDGRFGYTLSARTDRSRLLAAAEEVYRQLAGAQASGTTGN